MDPNVPIERALITRVIQDRDFHTLEKAQIDEQFFATQEGQEIFRYLKEVYHDPVSTGQVPSFEMVQYRFPGFAPFPTNDSAPVLAQQLRREKIRVELLTLSQNTLDLADRDPFQALAQLKGETSKISAYSEVGEDLSLAAAHATLLNMYETVADTGGLIGIPFPWDQLNEETQGMQNGQFIVLYGRPKSMKTWLALYIAIHAYVFARRRVLIYSREMSKILVAQRCAALMGMVDYKAFKNGKLQPELKQHVFRILHELNDDEVSEGTIRGRQPILKIVSDRSSAGHGGGGIGWLRAKIRETHADMCVVDGMYLMKDDRSNQRTIDWKAQSHISQDLKLTAQDFDIPVLGVTQANRAADKKQGEDLTELAYADALGQDADAVLRVTKKTRVDEASKQKVTELYLTAPGIREGVFDGIVIHGQPATNFRYIRTLLDDEEAKQAEYEASKKGPEAKRTFRDPRLPAQR